MSSNLDVFLRDGESTFRNTLFGRIIFTIISKPEAETSIKNKGARDTDELLNASEFLWFNLGHLHYMFNFTCSKIVVFKFTKGRPPNHVKISTLPCDLGTAAISGPHDSSNSQLRLNISFFPPN